MGKAFNKSRYYGKLPAECLEDLDGLLLKMKKINRKHRGKKVIKGNEIDRLPDDEFLRLWGYIRHCCQLVTGWKNVKDALKVIASNSGRPFEEVLDECIDSMTIHVYTYSWRKYRHSVDCAYVFSTAEFGFKSWISAQNRFSSGIDIAKVLHDEDTYAGRKVGTGFCCNSLAFQS